MDALMDQEPLEDIPHVRSEVAKPRDTINRPSNCLLSPLLWDIHIVP